MKIAQFESLHCDAGWRTFSFLKITTDDGLVGWSEYTEADGSRGLSAVIQGMLEGLIGLDPRPERLAAFDWHRAAPPTIDALVAELVGAGVGRFVLSHGGADPDLARTLDLVRSYDAEILVA